jgi:hypothetical protein
MLHSYRVGFGYIWAFLVLRTRGLRSGSKLDVTICLGLVDEHALNADFRYHNHGLLKQVTHLEYI